MSGAGDATKRFVAKSPNYLNLGPSSKLKIVRKPNVPKRMNRRFFIKYPRRRTRRNLLVVRPNGSVRRRGVIPISAKYNVLDRVQLRRGAIEARSSIFDDAPTLGNYLNFLNKSCFLNGDMAAWLTPSGINIDRCLKLARGGGIPALQISSRVRHWEKSTISECAMSEFPQLSYVSYLCALRIPSGAFPH